MRSRTSASAGFTVKGFKKDHLFKSIRAKDNIDLMKRIWAMPTFEIHGIVGGYTGPGVKTVIPPKATVKVSCRLVPEAEPEEDPEARQRVREEAQPRREGLGRGGHAAVPGTTTGPYADAVRSAMKFAFGTRAGVRPRGRLDRRRGLDGEGASSARCSSSGSRFPSTATTRLTRTTTGARPPAA